MTARCLASSNSSQRENTRRDYLVRVTNIGHLSHHRVRAAIIDKNWAQEI